jgi:hypothetical protein
MEMTRYEKIENLREMRRLQTLLADEIERNRLKLIKECDHKCGHLKNRIAYYGGTYYDKGMNVLYEYCDVCDYSKELKQVYD